MCSKDRYYLAFWILGDVTHIVAFSGSFVKSLVYCSRAEMITVCAITRHFVSLCCDSQH